MGEKEPDPTHSKLTRPKPLATECILVCQNPLASFAGGDQPNQNATMFFDLSIPYLETPATKTLTLDLHRLKTLARAMELGYTAVAYDRPFKSGAVISDADRCRIPLFSLPRLLEVSPALPSAVRFRRELNGVSTKEKFRQLTRATVAVDRVSVGSAFNARGVLRSYDLVAARPLDQEGFDRACQVADVDIIALDFPLKFRLKLPMVESAIKRGVYFEIKYSSLIADAQARRLMLSDARLLVDWTRGKNLIISSSATSVNDIRAPYDVANLSSFLLGLSKERAKAAISRNCSLLITNALKKKDYKEAIIIERIASDDKLDSESDWFVDCNDWDPISSGKGDLLPLDDISKLFSAVSKQPKSCPAIDFLSSDNSFSLKDHISSNGKGPIAVSERETNISCPTKPVYGTAAKMSSSANGVLLDNMKSVPVAPLGLNISGYEGSKVSLSGRLGAFADAEEPTIAVTVSNNETVETSTENNGAKDAAGIPCYDTQLKHCTFKGKDSLVSIDFCLKNTSIIDEISTIGVEDVRTSDSPGVVSVTTVAPSDFTELAGNISNAADGHLSSNGQEAFSLRSLDKIIPEEQIEATGLEREPNDEVLSDNAPQKMDFLETDPSGGRDGQLSGAVPYASELKALEEEALVDTDACMEEVLVRHEDHSQQEPTAAYGYRLKSGRTFNNIW